MMATVRTMTTSRLMISTVSQSGRGLARPRLGSVSTTKVVTSSSLSAMGSSQAPRFDFTADRRAIKPSRASVRPAVAKTNSAQPR
jgi:hypothetical protein